jgi:hypothetical protein
MYIPKFNYHMSSLCFTLLSYTIAMVGEYVTSCCLYSAHKLCQITWHSGLLAQLEEHIIVGICFHTCPLVKTTSWTLLPIAINLRRFYTSIVSLNFSSLLFEVIVKTVGKDVQRSACKGNPQVLWRSQSCRLAEGETVYINNKENTEKGDLT